MQDFGILNLQIGEATRGLSTIKPTDWFAKRVHECRVTFADFGRGELEELVILTRKTPILTDYGLEKITEEIDYADCSEADQFREEVRLLNRFLDRAHLVFIDDGIEPKVDPYRRTLTRRFSLLPEQPVRFDQAGRLFGPWWMNLKKERRGNIRIQGELPVELDFSNMFARLAYASVGADAPDGDLYDLSGVLTGYEATHRTAIKAVFNALLFGASSRLPNGLKKDLPADATMPKIKKAIEVRHPQLAPFLGTNIGFQLMYKESLILTKVLQSLNNVGVVGLGLHDAILVPSSQELKVKAIMMAASEEVSGRQIPVKVKSLM
jgi:hypothetical protein